MTRSLAHSVRMKPMIQSGSSRERQGKAEPWWSRRWKTWNDQPTRERPTRKTITFKPDAHAWQHQLWECQRVNILHTHSAVIKMFMLTHYYYLNSEISPIFLHHFSVPGFHQGSNVTVNHHFSSVPSNLWLVLCLSLSSMNLTVLKITDHLSYRMSLTLGLSDVFS